MTERRQIRACRLGGHIAALEDRPQLGRVVGE